MLVQNGPEKPNEMTTANSDGADEGAERNYLFRGDDNYTGGPIGRALGTDADSADIQNFADHVLRKESNLSSRFKSFTAETKIARRFISAPDNRYVCKAEMTKLRDLEAQGTINIWRPDAVYDALIKGPKKLAKQAADVRTAMYKNSEILIEGQIPEWILERVK